MWQDMNIGWAYWTWRAGNYKQCSWKDGSSSFVNTEGCSGNYNRSVDQMAMAAVSPYMSDKDNYTNDIE